MNRDKRLGKTADHLLSAIMLIRLAIRDGGGNDLLLLEERTRVLCGDVNAVACKTKGNDHE